MHKLIISGILTIILLSSMSLACQYTEPESYQELEMALTYKSSTTKIADALVIFDFINIINTSTFTVFNPNPYEIEAFFTYTLEGFKAGEQRRRLKIGPNDFVIVKELCYIEGNYGECSIKKDNVTYYLLLPHVLFPNEVNVTKSRNTCRLCNGVPCLDDGVQCSGKEQCGGGYCVEQICNSKPSCFMDNCKCERFSMIQCGVTRCVTEGVVDEGNTPLCSASECTTNYVDENGYCAKSPEQIRILIEQKDKEEAKRNQILLVLLIIFLVTILVYSIYFHKDMVKKREEEARRKARRAKSEEYKKIEQEQARATEEYISKTNILIQNIKAYEEALADKKRQLSGSKQDLHELHRILEDKKKKKEEIDSILEQIEAKKKIISELEDGISIDQSKKEEIIKPYPSYSRGFWVWRNPNIRNAYYPCYVNKDKNGEHTIKTDIEVHKDLAEKEIFNYYRPWFNKYYPNNEFEDLVVHHIDKDVCNYELLNLAVISHDEHRKLHKSSQHKNWESGVKELKEKGIQQPHIDQLGGESITDPYEILGISPEATKSEIRAAYLDLAQKNHPDKVSHLDKQFQDLAHSRFKKINEAYNKLKE